MTIGSAIEETRADGLAIRRDHLVLAVLLAVDLALVLAYVLPWGLSGRILYVFSLDAEGNIPVWWSSAQLMLAGLVLALVAARTHRLEQGSVSLALFAGLLMLMSLDETAAVHERVGDLTDRIFGDRLGTRFHHSGLWFAVVGLPFMAVAGVLLLRLGRLLGQVPRARVHMLAGLGVLLAGALGAEMLANFVVTAEAMEGTIPGAYLGMVAVEEGLEMAGGSILLWASLHFAARHWSTQAIRFLIHPASHGEKHAALRRAGLD